MRKALWETSSGALVALLNSGKPLEMADLYTITLTNGTVLRWSGHTYAISGNGNTWAIGPGITRSKIRWTVGIATDDLSITLTDNIGTVINGLTLMAWVRSGALQNATIEVDKAYWGIGQTSPVGALFCFSGQVGEIKGGRNSVDITVNSPLQLLDTQLPREIWQQGCLNTVFDSACTLQTSTFAVTATATSATDALKATFSTGLTQANGYFSQGYIVGLTGVNAGISRAIKTYLNASGTITVANPWPNPVSSGDTFTVVPGCDGTQSTCTTKFNNVIHFRGQPYIPTANTVM
jgi:uncharacterized phage protein (TIGR02218 family)